MSSYIDQIAQFYAVSWVTLFTNTFIDICIQVLSKPGKTQMRQQTATMQINFSIPF